MGNARIVSVRKNGVLVLGCALALAAGGIGALAVQDAEAATPTITAQSQAKGASKFASSTTKVKSLAAIKIKVKGAKASQLSYRVNGKGAYAKAGKAAGTKNKDARIIEVRLSGALAKKYDVYYRANLKGHGWTDWAENGAKAGDAYKLNITKYQVKLVKKGAKAPGGTYAPFVSKVTGNASVDQEVARAVSKGKVATLEGAIKYVVGSMSYNGDTGRGSITSYTRSRIVAEAKDAFGKKAGNCYTYAVADYCLARYLGYSARPIGGKIQYTSTKDGSLKTASMSWVEVKIGKTTWVYDAMSQYSYDRTFSNTGKYKFYAPKGGTYLTYLS